MAKRKLNRYVEQSGPWCDPVPDVVKLHQGYQRNACWLQGTRHCGDMCRRFLCDCRDRNNLFALFRIFVLLGLFVWEADASALRFWLLRKTTLRKNKIGIRIDNFRTEKKNLSHKDLGASSCVVVRATFSRVTSPFFHSSIRGTRWNVAVGGQTRTGRAIATARPSAITATRTRDVTGDRRGEISPWIMMTTGGVLSNAVAAWFWLKRKAGLRSILCNFRPLLCSKLRNWGFVPGGKT